MTARRHTALLVLLFSGIIALAQNATQQQEAAPPPPPASDTATISVRTSIVAITALVRDKKGELIRNLEKDQFKVKEDGKPVNIRYFDKDSDLPLQIGLLIDTSGSQKKFFEEERRASNTFLESMLTRPQDQAYIVRFDYRVLLLQPMTPDLNKLKQSLTLLEKNFPSKEGLDPKKGTRLYDALCTTTKNVANRERGRRAIIILTDGEDNGSTGDMEGAISCAQRADTAIYTVLYTDKRDPPIDIEAEKLIRATKGVTSRARPITGRAVMDPISYQSGGRLFIVDKSYPVEKIFQQIELDMRMQYRLGYTPAPSKPGSYHKLEVSSKDNKYVIQARVGYYTPE
jgi:Ca-activated chloride channel family protein